MTSSYQYQSLSSPTTEIRLLELLPGRGTIECRLRITDLVLAKDTYEPISYCWKTYRRKGWPVYTYKEKKKDEKRSVRVRVDGFGFHITKSLDAALRQMRLTSGVRVLWADAICINQADDGEKSAQVAMMGKIYQNGKRTLAWLGDADCWTGRAFKTLKMNLSQRSEDSSSTELYQDSEDESEYHMGDPRAESLHSGYLWRAQGTCQDILSTLALRSLLKRPYFERAWIVQEIVLSKNVLAICGKYSITGDELFNGLFSEGNLSTQTWLIGLSIGDLWYYQDPHCLDTIITKLSHTKASDPRDKLYSTLGLHQDCLKCGLMVVDYSKDVDEVFLEATKFLLSRSPVLDLLSMSYCTNRPNGRCVPSWVWNPQPRSTLFYLTRAEVGVVENPFCATQGSHSQPQFEGRRLGLLGYVFDEVKVIDKCFPAFAGIHLTYGLVSQALLRIRVVEYKQSD